MVDKRKDSLRCPFVGKTFIMNEASEVTNKETVNVFSAVGFVASDEGNAVWRSEP